jgi:hypothetical protein
MAAAAAGMVALAACAAAAAAVRMSSRVISQLMVVFTFFILQLIAFFNLASESQASCNACVADFGVTTQTWVCWLRGGAACGGRWWEFWGLLRTGGSCVLQVYSSGVCPVLNRLAAA